MRLASFILGALFVSHAYAQRHITEPESNILTKFFGSKGVVEFKPPDNPRHQWPNIDLRVLATGDLISFSFRDDHIVFGDDTLQLEDPALRSEPAIRLGFNPMIFELETGAPLRFEYLEIRKDGIVVFIDQAKKRKALLKVNSSLIPIPWWDFVRSYPIVFDGDRIQLRNSPDVKGRPLSYNRDIDRLFYVIELRDEWVKVRCTEHELCSQCSDLSVKEGWLRWRAKNKLIVTGWGYPCW